LVIVLSLRCLTFLVAETMPDGGEMARHFTSMSKQKTQNDPGSPGSAYRRLIGWENCLSWVAVAPVKYIDQSDKYLDRASSAPLISRRLPARRLALKPAVKPLGSSA
jgi:hypothetical protein